MGRELRTWFKTTIRKDHQKVRGDGLRILSPAKQTSKLSAISHDRIDLSKYFKEGGLGSIQKATKTTSVILKGHWKGMAFFYLTLEERKDCPESCPLIDPKSGHCYGNSMPLAKRANTDAPDFYDALESDLELLAKRYPQGFVVRLHELGDFFSLDYIKWWEKKLKQYSMLRVFGYTHCADERAKYLDKMHIKYGGPGGRWNIMNSQGAAKKTNRPTAHINNPLVTTCPQQTGKTYSCSTCGICMRGDIDINFDPHAKLDKKLAKENLLIRMDI